MSSQKYHRKLSRLLHYTLENYFAHKIYKTLSKNAKKETVSKIALLLFLSTKLSFRFPTFSGSQNKKSWKNVAFSPRLRTRDQTTTLQVIGATLIGSKCELLTKKRRSAIIGWHSPAKLSSHT